MEKIIYLKNGERAILHQELSVNEFVVEKLYLYNDRNDESGSGEPYEESSGVKIIVDKIFDTAPIQSIDKLYADKYKAFEELSVSVRTLTSELQTLRNDVHKEKVIQTNLSKLIFNKQQIREAKTIHFFMPNKVMPKLMTEYGKHSLKLDISITVFKDEMYAWYCKYYSDSDSWGHSQNIDMETGFFFDLSEEEIEKITIERAKKISSKLSPYYLKETDNKYLTQELIDKKYQYINEERNKQITTLQKTITDKQVELNLLLDK